MILLRTTTMFVVCALNNIVACLLHSTPLYYTALRAFSSFKRLNGSLRVTLVPRPEVLGIAKDIVHGHSGHTPIKMTHRAKDDYNCPLPTSTSTLLELLGVEWPV